MSPTSTTRTIKVDALARVEGEGAITGRAGQNYVVSLPYGVEGTVTAKHIKKADGSKAEVEEWQKRGPIIRFTTRFKAAGLMTESDYQAIEQEVSREVDAAAAFALESEFEPVGDLARFVSAEVTP